MHNTDSCGVLFRRLVLSANRVQRRSYSVTASQALWHIDGNHKLIRWCFVIHGGIDGFSKLPVFLKINNNTRAETVLKAFIEEVEEYGLPRRVRSDKGGENTLVAEYMFHQRGIERLRGCGESFVTFYFMEEQQIVDVSNELNMQLWVSGQHLDPEFNPHTESEIHSYGIDFEGPSSCTSDDCVDNPSTEQLSDVRFSQLNNILYQDSECFGIDIFQEALEVL